jgi:hypothetical protein
MVLGWLRRWLPLAAIVGLLGVAMLGAVYADPAIPLVPPPTEHVTETPGTRGSEPIETPVYDSPGTGANVEVPEWLSWAITVTFASLVLALLLLLLGVMLRGYWGRRSQVVARQSGLPAMEEARRLVRGAIDEGLTDLDDADEDPRRAIIACWVRLERAAHLAGVPRGAGDTAADLVDRLLRTHFVVSADVLDGLAATYREARFADHVLDTAARERARAALRQLRAEVGVAATADRSDVDDRDISTVDGVR